MPFKLLNSARLILRPITKKDLPALLSIHCKKENMQFVSDGKYHWTIQDLEDKYFNTPSSSSKLPLYFVVCLKESDEVIGEAALFNYNNDLCNIELGYIIDYKHQNRGLGYELCNVLINYCFLHLNAAIITARMYAENKPSVSLAKKCGMSILQIFNAPNGNKAFIFQLKKENKSYYNLM